MGRTFAMRVYAGSYWAVTLAVASIVVALLPSMDESPDLASFLPIFVGFIVVMTGCAALATFLPSAPGRRRFWLLAMIPALAFVAMNAPYLPYAATHPIDAAFPGTLTLLIGSVVLLIAGITAFRDIGAAGPSTGGGPRAIWAVAIVAGATLGAAATGYVGAAQAGGVGGAALAGSPTTSGTLVAKGTKFLTTHYAMSTSDVLGLFVENQDSTAHSFDIDALGIHVQVPAGATVAVAVKPTQAGMIEFYCAIPGHTEAGMAGTIEVQ